jgi:hypothetical protein
MQAIAVAGAAEARLAADVDGVSGACARPGALDRAGGVLEVEREAEVLPCDLLGGPGRTLAQLRQLDSNHRKVSGVGGCKCADSRDRRLRIRV